MMIFNTSRFHTPVVTMAVAGCVLQLASMAALADSAKLIASPTHAPAVAVLAHDDVRHQSVSYRDLNLSSPEGVSALTARIERAADSVCDGPPGHVTGKRAQEQRQCKSAAVAGAMAQVESQIVSARVLTEAEHKCEDAAHANAVAQLNAPPVNEAVASR
jgi:UrcA family protein